jgi:uncharacterized protein (TIGR02001 family)
MGLAAALLMSSPLLAQTEPAENPFTVEGLFIANSDYVDRGYVVDDDHIHFQPDLTLTYTTEIAGKSISPYIGVWSDMSGAPQSGDPEWLYEIDPYIGVAMDLGSGFTLDFVYTYNNSPANGFDDVHELAMTLSHSSEKDWLNPSINIMRELDDKNGGEDTYIELRLTPGFDVKQVEKLRLDFPLVAGLSPDGFYEDEDGDESVLGFVSGGIAATYAINDHWSLVGGVDYYWLACDATRETNNDNDRRWWAASALGLSIDRFSTRGIGPCGSCLAQTSKSFEGGFQ